MHRYHVTLYPDAWAGGRRARFETIPHLFAPTPDEAAELAALEANKWSARVPAGPARAVVEHRCDGSEDRCAREGKRPAPFEYTEHRTTVADHRTAARGVRA